MPAHRAAIVLATCLATALPLAAAEPAFLAGRLLVTEVLYDPSGSEPGSEAFELWNPSALEVDLAGWTVTDRDPCRPAGFPSSVTGSHALSGTIGPFGHVAVVIPSYGSPRCLALANAGDELDLVAPDGTVVETVAWGGGSVDGWSLQRCVADDAWTRAAPTLGSANSVCAPPLPST